MILQSDIESEEVDPEFDDSDSCYSADSTLSSSYTESDSASGANISEEAAVTQQTDYVLDSQRPPKRVRTRSGFTNRAPLKSFPSKSTMPPANVDINDTQATPMGISIANTNAKALPSNNPENEVSKWTNEPNVVPKIKFTGTAGLKIQINNMQPIDFFKLFLTDDLINMMVTETNRYADQEINKHRPLRRSSRLNLWKPVDHQEMCQFLGILLNMGCVKLPTFEHYWSTNILYRFPMFSKLCQEIDFSLYYDFGTLLIIILQGLDA